MTKRDIYIEYLEKHKFIFLELMHKESHKLSDESKKGILHFMLVYDSLVDVVKGL